MRLGTAAANYHGEGSFGHKAQRKEHGIDPPSSDTPLNGEQLESWVRRLKVLHAAAPHRSPRSLMQRLLQGVQREQVLALYDETE